MEKTRMVEVFGKELDLKVGKLLAPKGTTVKTDVRNAFRKSVIEKENGINLSEWEVANDNSLLLPLAVDISGKVVYARIELSITINDSFSTGRKTAKKEEPAIPKLF